MFNYFKEPGEAAGKNQGGGKEEPKKEIYKQMTADEWVSFEDSDPAENPFIDL
jgi:hypothetical protein